MSLRDAALALAMQADADATLVEASAHTPVEQVCEAMRAELAPKFREIWDLDNQREYLRMARRVGKTHYLIRRSAALTARGTRESLNPYILPTIKSARLVVWPLMRRIVARHFPESVVNETLATIRLPTGGTIVLGGCETMADVGRWYGMAFEIATIDERGNFPDQVLVELDDEAIEPSLMDFGGKFAGAGNPGRVLRGRWYEQSRDGERNDPTPLYTGDARENPFLRNGAAAYFEAVKQRHGWTDESPTFRRQYLGEWVEDAGALVFPVAAHNMIDSLPTRSTAGGVLPASQWRYVIGVDVGVVDATAIAVVAAHQLDNREVVVATEKHTGWITSQLAERLRELRAQYRGATIVLDTGGMGKLHAEELSRRFGLFVEAAEKREKESAIRLTRDNLRGGRIAIVAQANDSLLEEWSVLGWDDDKRLPDPDQADHASDAVGYALRKLRHYIREGVRPELEAGTPAWFAAEEQRMRRERIERHLNQARRTPWG